MAKTIAEQIADLEATRNAKADEMDAVMQKSLDEGRSTDTAEAEQFDTLEREIKTLDGDIGRLKKLERIQAAKAQPADPRPSATQRFDGVSTMQLKPKPLVLDKGVAFARYARCLGLGAKYHRPPEVVAQKWYPNDEVLYRLLEKAAVPAANTSDATFAGNLVSDENGMFADFVDYLRPMTILGKFGNNGVPSLRRVPFRTALISQDTGGAGYWVGEGKAKPLTSWTYGRTTLEPLKVANIAVATMELLRDSSPSADALIRDELAAALRERLDIDFVDPGKAASAGVSPASILNAQTPITSAGSDAEDVRTDIRAIFGAFIADNNAPSNGVWIMSATTALALSLMQNPLGQAEFPGIGMSGGMLFGLPVIVSEYMTRDTEGAIVALVNASDIYFADEGGIEIKVSDQASLEMDDAPTNDSAPAGAVTETTMVSMWQTNSVAFLAERTVNWALRRTDAVQYLTAVTWGEPS